MLRWGLLGTSFISQTMARAITASPGSCLTAAAGRDAGRLQAFCAGHAIAHAHQDYAALIADSAVDVVYVGLPNHLHRPVTELAAAAGKPVLCEKSLTTRLADAEALVATVRRADVFCLEGLMYLAHPLMAKLTDLLTNGDLGGIQAIHCFYAADIWQVVNPDGGGTIYNLGCYPASLLHLVMQTAFGPAAFVDRICAGHGTCSPKDGNISDALLSVRFGNGVLASLHATDNYGMSHDVRIQTDRGVLCCPSNPWLPEAGTNHLSWQPYGEKAVMIPVSDPLDAFDHQVRLVERCLAAGLREAPRPAPRLQDSLEIMALLTEWEAQCHA
ncbi:MAG: Gfo/Idh/MocA family oxidoreductase [Rhodobacteraceae bacterium]|nr:Gfo/Idh/MocA family oxidoreductase [Paracoccaceae bacterium]